MKKVLTLAIFFVMALMACNKGGSANVSNLPKPTEYWDKISYMIGYDIGQGIGRDSVQLNFDYFLLAIKHGMAKDSTFADRKEYDSLRMKFQEMMMKKADARMKKDDMDWKAQGPKNKVATEKFLAENKTKPGVITTATGLQYQIIKEGTGQKVQADDKIKFHIKGSYMDGKEFDNSYNRQPIVLDVDKQIPGWKEAWLLMKVGSKFKIWLPPSLGWGDEGLRPTIPPASVLIFEFELLSIEGKADPMPANPQIRPN